MSKLVKLQEQPYRLPWSPTQMPQSREFKIKSNCLNKKKYLKSCVVDYMREK